jgi:hypothetical protein
MIWNNFREIQLCIFAKMVSLCWLNYIYFVNFYILSHNKDVHNYKTQFTHKEIYGRVNKRQSRLSNTYVPNYPITTCSGHFFF